MCTSAEMKEEFQKKKQLCESSRPKLETGTCLL